MAVQGVLNDLRHLNNFAMFKTMGYSPGFLLKIGRFRNFWYSPEILINKPESSWKCVWKNKDCVSGCLRRFPGLTQIRHVQNHGLQSRLFAQNHSFSALRKSHEIFTNDLESSKKSFCKHVRPVLGSSERFSYLAQVSHLQNHGLFQAWLRYGELIWTGAQAAQMDLQWLGITSQMDWQLQGQVAQMDW